MRGALRGGGGPARRPRSGGPHQPYAEQRRRVLDDFERRYLRALLEQHQGKVAQAAADGGHGPRAPYRLLRRHGIKP